MNLAIMVHSHDGPRVFGDIPGCFLKYWFSCEDSIRENVVQYNGASSVILSTAVCEFVSLKEIKYFA